MKKQFKILFVDDDTSLNQLLEKALSERGYQVDIVADGLSALNMLEKRYYDVAVLDNYLPKMNGIEVLKHIREQKLTTKVIMITAVDEQQLAHESIKLGADAILAKPFEFEKLISSIERL